MKEYNYFSENASFKALFIKNEIIFNVRKISVPDFVKNEKDVIKLISGYILNVPNIHIFNSGHVDSFFTIICQLFSDAEAKPLPGGEFNFPKYINQREAIIDFEFKIKTKKAGVYIDKIQINKICF